LVQGLEWIRAAVQLYAFHSKDGRMAQEEEEFTDATLVLAASVRLDEAYKRAAASANCKINPLVMSSLMESVKAQSHGFFVEAPGCHPTTFTSRIDDVHATVLCQAFATRAQFLVKLDLSHNLLTDVGAGQLAMGLLCQGAAALVSLSLKANSIGADGCEAICQALRRCSSIQSVDLSRNPLERSGGLVVVEFLKDTVNLAELILADTEIDIDVLVAIATALLVGNPTPPKLKVCNIENPRIGTLQEEHTVHFGRMLRVNTHLSEIYLGKHRMRDEGVRQLVSFLVENKTLRVLDLRCNELGVAGAQHIGTLLKDDCQLSLLNLTSNRIGEEDNVDGAHAIAGALLSNRMLRYLNLDCNSLCGEALGFMADAIANNSTLESVALFHNKWDQPSSLKFHEILADTSRILPLRTDFVTSQVDDRIDVCKLYDFELSPQG